MRSMRTPISALCLAVCFSFGCGSQKTCKPVSYAVGSAKDAEPLLPLHTSGPCEDSSNGEWQSLRGTGEGICRVEAETTSGRSATVDIAFASAAGACGFEIVEITAGPGSFHGPEREGDPPVLGIEFPCGCRGNQVPETCTACDPMSDDSCVCTTATTDPSDWDRYDCYAVGGSTPVWRRNSQLCPNVDGHPPDGGP
jgi:hypothetical protein